MQRLRDVRKERGYSQHDLAQASGVSRATIARIESREDYKPHEDTIGKLAEALEVVDVELFDESELSFPFKVEDLLNMDDERLTDLLMSLSDNDELQEAAENVKATAVRHAGRGYRMPEGPQRDAELQKTIQAAYFWGYLDGHGDQKKFRRELEIADRMDKMEEEMQRFKDKSSESNAS